jgi:hypothetical protein
LAALAVISGLAIVVTAQRVAPISPPPIFDGVVVVQPYRWLMPPPGLPGGAKSGSDTEPADVQGFASTTPETPPQAQVIADIGALDLPRGTTSMTVSIEPVAPPAVQPVNGVIAGNVYRFRAINQRGASIGVKAGSQLTMLFRGPPNLTSAKVEAFDGSQWQPVGETDPAGIPDMFTTLVNSLGEFALVAPSGWTPVGAKAAPATPAATGNAPTPAVAVTEAPSAPAASLPAGSPASDATPLGQGGNGTQSSSPAPVIAGLLTLLLVGSGGVVLVRLWMVRRR